MTPSPPAAPARLPLVERRRRETAQRILAAATALFTERGFDAVTTDEIAARAGCSRATLFRYCGSKEDTLFLGVLDMLAEVRRELAALHPCPDPWVGAKEVGLPRFVAYLSGEAALPRECVALWSSHPALLSRYLHVNHMWERMLAEFFATAGGVAAESDLDGQLRASVLCAAVRAAFRVYARPGTDVHASIEHAVRLLENGFRPAR